MSILSHCNNANPANDAPTTNTLGAASTSRYAMGIEFCGSAYRGWQMQQTGVASIQLALQTALSQVANHPIEVVGAGRTDAGVHATQMFAHFDAHAKRSTHSWLRGANSLLPPDIALQWLYPVDSQFHARFTATARRYQYIIYTHPYRPAVLNGKVTHVFYPLNTAAMQIAATYLVGTHDFSSFRAAACQSNQPVRTVSHCTLSQYNTYLVLDIEANGFLHHMVRNIVGCLLAIGTNEQPPTWIPHLLLIKDRTQAAPTAPADGLYFIHASYANHVLPFNIQPISPLNLHTPWLSN